MVERRRGGDQQAPRVRVLCGKLTALDGALDEDLALGVPVRPQPGLGPRGPFGWNEAAIRATANDGRTTRDSWISWLRAVRSPRSEPVSGGCH